MDGLVGLKTVNYFSLILVVLAFFNSFNIVPVVKWTLFGITLVAFGILYFSRKAYQTDHTTFLDESKKGFIVIAVLLVLSLEKKEAFLKINDLAPFVLVYIVSCITVLRIQRQREHTSENKLISRLNYIYSFSLILLAFLLGAESSRKFIWKALVGLWYLVPRAILNSLPHIYLAVMYVLVKPFELIIYLIKLAKAFFAGKTLIMDENVLLKNAFENIDPYEARMTALLHNKIIPFIVWAVIISLTLLFLVKFFQARGEKRNKNERFEEEKEFLIGENKGTPGFVKRAAEYMKFRNNNELIRLYYSKILKLCLKKQVNLESGDTSLDVNRKSGFDPTRMEALRDTYIKVRYSDYTANKNEVKEFAKNVKNIEKE